MNLNQIFITAAISVPFSVIVFLICNVYFEAIKTKKRNKEQVFSILMQMRGMIDKEKVRALNVIQVVFYKDKKVLSAWKEYHTSLKLKGEEFTTTEINEIKKKEIRLLEEMARTIGYKKLTWDIIDESYYPVYLTEEYRRNLNQEEFMMSAVEFMSQLKKTPQQKVHGKKR